MRYTESENPYIWCRFTTGDSVTITIYKSSDSSVIVNAVSMSELVSTGYFKYQFNPSPTELTEYFYIATNTIEEHAGKIILGGYPDSIKNNLDNPSQYMVDVNTIKTALEADDGKLYSIYAALLNKMTVTSTLMNIYKDDATTLLKTLDLSDDDTTVIRS